MLDEIPAMIPYFLHSQRVRAAIALGVVLSLIALGAYVLEKPKTTTDSELRKFTTEEKLDILAQLSANLATSTCAEKDATLRSLQSSQDEATATTTEEEKLRLLQSLDAN